MPALLGMSRVGSPGFAGGDEEGVLPLIFELELVMTTERSAVGAHGGAEPPCRFLVDGEPVFVVLSDVVYA